MASPGKQKRRSPRKGGVAVADCRPLQLSITKYASKDDIQEVLPELTSMKLDHMVNLAWSLQNSVMCEECVDYFEGRRAFPDDHRVRIIDSKETFAQVYKLPAKGDLLGSLEDWPVQKYFGNLKPKKDGYDLSTCEDDKLHKVLRILNPIFTPARWYQVPKKVVVAVIRALQDPNLEIDWADFLHRRFMDLKRNLHSKTKRCFLSPYLFHIYYSRGFLIGAEDDYFKQASVGFSLPIGPPEVHSNEEARTQRASTATLASDAADEMNRLWANPMVQRHHNDTTMALCVESANGQLQEPTRLGLSPDEALQIPGSTTQDSLDKFQTPQQRTEPEHGAIIPETLPGNQRQPLDVLIGGSEMMQGLSDSDEAMETPGSTMKDPLERSEIPDLRAEPEQTSILPHPLPAIPFERGDLSSDMGRDIENGMDVVTSPEAHLHSQIRFDRDLRRDNEIQSVTESQGHPTMWMETAHHAMDFNQEKVTLLEQMESEKSKTKRPRIQDASTVPSVEVSAGETNVQWVSPIVEQHKDKSMPPCAEDADDRLQKLSGCGLGLDGALQTHGSPTQDPLDKSEILPETEPESVPIQSLYDTWQTLKILINTPQPEMDKVLEYLLSCDAPCSLTQDHLEKSRTPQQGTAPEHGSILPHSLTIIPSQLGEAVGPLAATEDSTFRDKIPKFSNLLESLRASLSKNQNPALQINAGVALASWGLGNQSTRENRFRLSGLLDIVVKSLKQDQNLELAGQAARAIATLALTKDSTTKGTIARFPDLIESLKVSLTKDHSHTLQSNAADALANLACGDQSICEIFLHVPGMLDILVKSVNHDQNSCLAQRAARVIALLADGNNSTIKGTIARFPNLLESLKVSLSKEDCHALQSNAAQALANLACEDQSICEIFLHEPGMLDILVKSVNQDQNRWLAQQAARVIAILANKHNSTKEALSTIASWENLLESLKVSLSKEHNHGLQSYAAMALANFAYGDQSICEFVFRVPGMLDILVKSVNHDQNRCLQERVAVVIANLVSKTDAAFKDKVACVPSLLESLVGLMNQDQSPQVAEEASRAIANLSYSNSTTKGTIASSPNLLESLKVSLSKEHNLGLQTYAARALVNLACGYQSICEMLDNLVKSMDHDQNSHLAEQTTNVILYLVVGGDATFKDKVACVPNLLECLGVSLSKDKNPTLQMYATMALANLVYRNQSIQDKVLNVPQMLESLVRLMDQGQSPHVAQEASRAITNLSNSNSTTKGTIASSPNLLESLKVSLSKEHDPVLQTNAARALVNLACDDQSICGQIFHVPGMLDNLVKLVDQDKNSDLAEQAADVILNLTVYTDATFKDKVVCVPNLLECLGVSLSKGQNPTLQTIAANAIRNLADSQSSKDKISTVPEISQNLIKLVNQQDQNSRLVEEAARAIFNLGST